MTTRLLQVRIWATQTLLWQIFSPKTTRHPLKIQSKGSWTKPRLLPVHRWMIWTRRCPRCWAMMRTKGLPSKRITPPAGTDIKDMDEELSALLTDEGEDFGASFEDDTPPTGVHVGGNSDQLFASIDNDEEEDRTLVTLRQTDAHTPPTGVQVDKVNEELQLLWDDEDLTEASVEIPLDEADELFETASAEVRILDEESSPTNEAESMDEELLDLFDDAPAAADAEEGVVANGQEPQTSLDPNLPFHKVPWGLMVALKNGLNTEDILTKNAETLAPLIFTREGNPSVDDGQSFFRGRLVRFHAAGDGEFGPFDRHIPVKLCARITTELPRVAPVT